ncbi:hemicentin-1-like isoform X2 [Bolinopsis microptera]|uniref:hemicentin-1-like isoform X2 n=1 Tax=Bolinopsis microptera TaxID=2820187 RepID=UPI00307ABA09
MKNFLLLFVLCLLFNNSKCGPDIFKLTSQPESQTINPGGTVTLSCVATGRTGIIAYSWYQLKSDFNTPPQNTDLISGATGAEYLVDAVDVDESGEGNLFQCKATYGDDIILSNVAMVKYTLEDKLSFTGDSYENIKSETGDDEADPSAFLWRLKCNDNVPDWSTAIKNGEPYDVYWYKGTETDRVEVKYTNMWTYYTSGSTGSNSITLDIGGSKYAEYTDLGQYDLVIFNPQTSDGGTYYCKAVSRGNGNSVTLGSTILDVKEQNNDYDIQSGVIAAGYVVLAVDETGDRKVTPNVGDKVLLMCGGVCRASDKWDIQYKWRKGSNSNSPEVSTSREHIVQTDSAGSVEYRCEIVNGASCGNPDAEKVLFVVQTAEIDPLLQFTFSTSPPEYMWYDTSDNFKSDEPFEINCDGSVSSVTATFLKHVFKKGAQVSSTLPYTFESDIKSARSGVYQCGLYNDPVKMTWYQKTTNVIIASDPTSSITPTSKSVEDGTSATFTCTVGGYPIESVTISDPKSVRTDCPQTSGDITCSSIANTSKYEITVSGFSSAKNGDYTCTVQTRWYKTDSTDMGKVSSDKITLQYVKASTTELTASKTSVNKGDSITLTCVVEGYPEPNRPTLKKKGSSSPIAWTSTCTGTNVKKCLKTFSSPTYSDSGEYLCEGSNTIDGVSKTSDDDVSLTIVGDVEASLAQSPSGTELDKDSPVTYTCKVEGNALPTKLTFKKGNVALKSYDSSDSSSSHADVVKETYSLSYTHTISSLTLEDSAVYMCEGENDNSGIKTDGDTKTLTVVSDVIVTLSASTDTPSFGDTFTITCLTTGGRKPESVELKHDSISIKSYPTNSGFCSSTDSFSLKCTYTTTADYTSGGKYECIGKNIVANNKEVTTTELIDVYVSQTVEVSMTPSSESEVPTGIGFTITCHVEGGGQPHKVTLTTPDSTVLTWLGDSSSGGTLTCIGTFELTCKHTISSPTYTDEGDYRCDGYNRLPGQTTDKTKSATVSLVPINNVDVTLTKSTTEVAFGASFLITCVADGGRIPFYLKLDLRRPDSSVVNDIVLYNKSSQSPASVTVSEELNTLTYIHSVTSSSYDHDGTYKCLSKNRAASNNEQNDEKSENIIVVKDVTSSISDLGIVNKGSQLQITCFAEGNRRPHEVALKKSNLSVITWASPASDCTVLPKSYYEFVCVYNMGIIDYSDGGIYMCVGKNKALGNKEVSSSVSATAKISQSVLTVLNPNSETELSWGSDPLSITCYIEGGLQPHKATLEIPGGTTITWTRDSSSSTNNFNCNGDHEVTCVHEITSDSFDNTGKYNCTGFNMLPESSAVKETKESVEVIVVKDVEATLTSSSTSDEVDFGSELTLTCKVEGGRTPFFLLVEFDDGSNVVKTIIKYEDTDQSNTDQSNKVTREKNSLEYVHTIGKVVYENNGSYKCTGKNKAFKNEEKTNKSIKNAVVVKDVEIAQINDFDTDFGSSFTFDFTLNGGRPPHLVSLKKGNQVILDISMCTGTNEMTCSSTIGDSDVDFEYDGAYTVTAENRAKTDALKTTTINFRVTVYKEVTATISPSLNSELTYNEDTTITCEVVGGLPPHQVDLILPKQDSMTWTKNGPVTDLTCSGEHELVCKYTFKSDYDSDGVYKCKGYNEVRKVTKVMESSAVTLTTVRKTQVNVPEKPISVLTNGEIKIDCIIVGKPLVDKSSVTWTHSTDLDLSEFVDTVKGNQDNFTLNSTLTMREPLTSYTGTFNCNVADGEKTISGAVEVFIANKEYLESPTVSHTGGEFSEEGSRITVTCRVEGFPAPSASLTYEKQDGTLPTLLNPESFDSKSTTLTEFVFSVTTTCDYAKYDFSCNAQTTISSQPFKSSTLITGPTTTGCENPLPVILGGGIGGGVVFIVIIAVVVFFILRRIKVNKDRSYTPKNGAEFPNPTFVADPTYATVGDSNQVGATGGYSHLNRPAGETDEEGYSCIGQLKPGTANVHPTGEDAYATLDTTSNGMLGLRRQGSNETYAALNRPAPGKAKRGVISKYKPMSNKPKTFGMPPNKPATDDIEMGETSHGGQPDPTYATVNPQTLKSKMKPSNYADVTLPDLPPEVPIYGNSSLIQRPIPSEYADVTVAPPQTPYNMADRQRPILSEYADVTLPGPPEVLYSNMANRQDNTPEEDPVYAQVDLKNRTLPQRRVEEEEDLPPDVPVYGTIGQLTEPDIPDFEDEDPYATVEFVPKSKRKPPRPKPKENASEGVYATITDIKENL